MQENEQLEQFDAKKVEDTLNANIEEGSEHIDSLVYEWGPICEQRSMTQSLILVNADSRKTIKVRLKAKHFRNGIPGHTETFEDFTLAPRQKAQVRHCPVPEHYSMSVGWAVVYEVVSITNA